MTQEVVLIMLDHKILSHVPSCHGMPEQMQVCTYLKTKGNLCFTFKLQVPVMM